MEFLYDSNVPEYYKELTGPTCKYCGSPFVVNDTRTTVKCSNPYCVRIIAGQMKGIIDVMGIKGYGISKALTIATQAKYRHIMDFFLYPPIELQQELSALILRTNRLDDAIRLLFIPEFSENATKLFSQYNCMEELLAVYDAEGTLDYEVMKVFGTGKLYENICEIINDHMEEFFYVDEVFDFDIEVISAISSDVDICVTGSVSSDFLRKLGLSVTTREELVQFLNNTFNKDGFRFNLKKSVTSSVSFVVCDNESALGNSKAKVGESRGILTTTDNMIASIVTHIKKGKE